MSTAHTLPLRFIFVSIGLLFISSVFGQERLEVGVTINGQDISQPWNGGFNAPQFSNIDLNRDGIPDMISFDRQGDMLRTYIHLPATGRWVLDWNYQTMFPPLVDWVLVKDFDQDGVEDLFTSSSATGVAGITVYKGHYENDEWSWTEFSDRGKYYLQVPTSGDLTNLYVSWDDIPGIADIDGDGDLDVLSFDPGGSFITYFKNQSVESGWGLDSLRFTVEDVCWGKILENELSEEVYLSDDPDKCSDGHYTSGDVITPRHAGSTILCFDQDYDGDQDALIGDISSRRLVFVRNGLNAQKAWITDQDAHFPSADTSVDIPYYIGAYEVQLDDDPEPEILAAVNARALSEDVHSVWRYDDNPFTDGPLEYQLTEKGFLQNEMIDLGSYTRPAFADVNGDGLLDIVTGGYNFEEGSLTRLPSLWLFQNEGSSAQPYFHLISTDYLGMSVYGTLPSFDFAPAFGDVDGNGTIDLVVGEQNGKLFFYKNKSPLGSPFDFEPAVYPYMNIAVGVSSTPQIADINGDGLNDLVVGERTGNADNLGRCSNLNYFQNIGTPGNAIFGSDPTAAPNTQCYGRVLFDIPVGLPQYSTPVIVPTPDGPILLTGTDRGKIQIYDHLEEGITGSLDLMSMDYMDLDFGNRSAPALADLNGNGFYELLAGNQRGGLELIETDIRVGTVAIPEPWTKSDKPYLLTTLDRRGQYTLTWQEEAGSYFIFDLQGKLISQRQPGSKYVSIDLSAFPSGIYVMQIEAKGKIWPEKLLKAE